jgi:hypothetical protein
MPTFPSIDLAPQSPQELFTWLQRSYTALWNASRGKINAMLDVTLMANQSQTDIIDPRFSGTSYIGLDCPLTAHAAAEIGAGTLYVASQGKGTLTLAHANNAQTDRTYRLLIMG